MPERIDRIIIDVLFLGSASAVLACFIDNAYILVPLVAILYIAFKLTYMHVFNRIRNKKEMSVGDILFAYSLMTVKEVTDALEKTLPEGGCVRLCENVLRYGEKTYAILIKFSSPSPDDMARIRRTVEGEIHVLSREIPRNVLLYAKKMGLHVVQVPLSKLRKYLIKHNALPPLPSPSKNKSEKVPLKERLSAITDPRKLKYYLFSCSVTLISSLWVPYKAYYVVTGVILAVLSALTVVRKYGR